MAAYARYSIGDFLAANPQAVVGLLQTRYAADGFASQYTQQTKAWDACVPLLQRELRALTDQAPESNAWVLLLEYPLYRLRRRLDAILLTPSLILVIEGKFGQQDFSSNDARQVEEYALDLRDFHAGSRDHPLVPILWCPSAIDPEQYALLDDDIWPVTRIGAGGLCKFLRRVAKHRPSSTALVAREWDVAPYRPVPTIIQAATALFAGNDVQAIARADATNLASAAKRIVEIVVGAKANRERALVFLTGVPGSGKTLAGLKVVHDAVASGAEERGDIVYLSGNTPLVLVLREALARDSVASERQETLREARAAVRARIQHIIDFLQQYLRGRSTEIPHEHAIVFDEAQRAWDIEQGRRKFDRPSSEPSLLLEILGRHNDWCACICLVGGGQEINDGEDGVAGWGDALRALTPDKVNKWTLYGPRDVLEGGESTGGVSIGNLPQELTVRVDGDLSLSVPLRSYRSPRLSEWVGAVLSGDVSAARQVAAELTEYPIVITRSLPTAKAWLANQSRGERRFGLLASSGARRLRAEGLGILLGATDGDAIAHWYLNDRNDIRSSYVLEVPANEYACQGLEIDRAAICWGGDFVFREREGWICRQLSGTRWMNLQSVEGRRFVLNTYRVLLTRAREGMVLWVPMGSATDSTRDPAELDETARFLIGAGASLLPDIGTFPKP